MRLPSWLWIVLMSALILAVAGLLVVSIQVTLLIFAGVLFGLSFNRLTHLLSGATGIDYRPCYAVVVVLFIAIIAGGCYYSGSRAVKKVAELTSELDVGLQQLRNRLESSWEPAYSEVVGQVQKMINDGNGALPNVLAGASRLLWALTAVAVIFCVGLYVAYDPDLYRAGILKLIPQEQRPRASEVLRVLRHAMIRWIVGRLISMGIVGVATAAALWLLDVPLPVTLGVLAALLTFVPNLGPLLAAIPQATLAFQVGLSTVLYVAIFNVALQTIESYLLTPVVMRYEVTLPPALTVFAQLLMGVLLGTIGVIMAAPLTLVIMVLVQTLYIGGNLDDPEPGQLVEAV